MINYIVARKKNMTDGSIKYYAKVAPVTPVYVNDIAARISKTCTVTEHDVKAVLSALQEQVIYSLSDGHSVRLGDLAQLQRLSADIILPITQLRFWRFRVGTTDFFGGGSEA